ADVALLLQHRGDLHVAARDLDHARHLDDAAHVGLLQFALHDLGARGGLRRHAGRRFEGAAAVLLQLLRIGEIDDGQRAAHAVGGGITLARADGAVGTDRDLPVVGLERDRAAAAEDGIAFRGHQLAGGVDLERAVARVALAARCLHREETVAVDGDVERIAGALHAAGVHVVPDAAVAHIADARTRVGAGGRGQIFLEQRTVGLVAGGVDVGDVVGDDVHFAAKRDLARQSDQKRILHRQLPWSARLRRTLPRRVPTVSSVPPWFSQTRAAADPVAAVVPTLICQ